MRKTIKQQAIVMIAVLTSLVMAIGTPSFAQNVAEAARQERERKKQLEQHSRHVYTNEDLARAHILVPEDEARVIAHDTNGTEVATESPVSLGPGEAKEQAAPTPGDPGTTNVTTTVVTSYDSRTAQPPLPMTKGSHDVSAPVVVDRSASTASFLPSTNQPASVGIPVSASKPVRKDISHQQQQAPVAIQIPLPATTMPFSQAVAYGMFDTQVSAPTSPIAGNTIERENRAAAPPPNLVPDDFPAPVAFGIPSIKTFGLANVEVSKPLAPLASSLAKRAGKFDMPAPLVTPVMVPANVPTAVSTSTSVGLAHAVVSAPASPVIPGTSSNHSNFDILPPVVTPPVAPAPVVLGEYDVIRPTEPTADKSSANCASDCRLGTAPANSEAETIGAKESIKADIQSKAISSANQADASDATRSVRVEPGDSLWRLAEHYFGSGFRWRRLAKLNPQLADPNRIQAGQSINVPSRRNQSAKQVVIQPGDTLWKVAKNEFGSPLALNCIAQANPQLQSVDLVRAGETLVVPESCGVLEQAQN